MTEAGREPLTDKRQATFDALLDATLRTLNEAGFDGLTVRSVAAAAGVTHTTAYSFVTSKAQLIAELYRREIEALAAPEWSASATPAERVVAALHGPATLFNQEPHVAHAVQAALIVGDVEDEVRRLRDRIGLVTLARLRAALPGVTRDVVDIVFATYNGALLRAGTRDARYDEVAALVGRLVDMLDGAGTLTSAGDGTASSAKTRASKSVG